ncbi:MAG TPA: universal stress protein [Solirubrobacteraceae bacterium]|nr:universal stress protein [Solirubrobacteraceae bacterium]
MSTPPGPVIVGVGDEPYADDAIALGTALAALLNAPVEQVAVPGHDPAAVLGTSAAHDRAAMIVLGPTHHHLLRTLRGTARHLIGGATCPVAVAPAGYAGAAPTELRRVGVGLEPTPEAACALDVAHELAARAGGSLVVLGVALPLAPFAIDDGRDQTPYLDAERKTVQDGLERELARLAGDVPCRAEARIGSPAGELIELSREVDLLVCGSRGRGALRAATVGSVTERLLRYAECPVVIVPRATSSLGA